MQVHSPTTRPRQPAVHLNPVVCPAFKFYDFAIGAFLLTDETAIAEAVAQFRSQPPSTISSDIETRGLGTMRFQITCVTVAFYIGCDAVSVLLDPVRRPSHRKLLTALYDHADRIVFHNGAFDVAPLYAHRLMTRGHILKLRDTIVAARMIETQSRGGRDLDTQATKYGLMDADHLDMSHVFETRGSKTATGWWDMDIDSASYVTGAMADTVATLRLWGQPGVNGHGICTEAARYLSADSEGYGGLGVLNTADAAALVDETQQVNAIVQARVARGYAVDTGYLEAFTAEYGPHWRQADLELRRCGVRPGQGIDIITALAAEGLLPANWPRTKGGQLSADKKAMDRLESLPANARTPLVALHLAWMGHKKTFNYVSKVIENAHVTGRLHPEFHILGASATGRMSGSDPEIQQFTDSARGVIVADDGHQWVSVDWKSIEPVVLATASGDRDFLDAMRAGHDPYEPVGQRAGVDRKAAKRMMLANLYGQGADSAAHTHGLPLETVITTMQVLQEELPAMYRTINELKRHSRECNHINTLAGRVLNQDMYLPSEGRRVVKDYIAPNHFCQGTALDILHAAILELEQRGLSDHVHLWMHDEIIADADIGEELADVMATPPPFLCAAAERHGMAPFLAIDANDVGERWKAV